MIHKTLIDRVTEPGAITAVFQPIVAILGVRPTLHAVEGLSRGPKGTTMEAPDVLFEFARRKHQEVVVDRAAIAAILAEAHKLPDGLPIQINVHASTIGRDPSFAQYLQHLSLSSGVALDRLTLEILEHSNYVEESNYLAAIDSLRAAKVSIALDDVGVGTSNLRMILLTRPSLLKLDRLLIDGIADDLFQQATLRAVQVMAAQAGAAIVAEGVERASDLALLQRLEVDFAQGYFFSRPRPAEELALSFLDAPYEPRSIGGVEPVAELAAAG